MRHRRAFRVHPVALTIGVAAVAGGVAWTMYQASADDRAVSVALTATRAVTVDGVERRYLLVYPRGAIDDDGRRDTTDPPLVILYHGAYQTGARLMQRTDGWRLADRTGALIAYPDGLERTWGADFREGSDDGGDLALHDAIVDDVERRDDVDADRVTVGGFSVGGMFALRVGCERAGAITGVVNASGSMRRSLRACRPEQPVDVTMLHARNDPIIGFDGAARMSVGRMIGGNFIDDVLPVATTAATWRSHNGCDSRGRTCDGGVRVRLIVRDAGGHGWTPTASDAVVRLVDASEAEP